MNLRSLIALSMGAVVAGTCIAGESKGESTTLPLTAKQLLTEAHYLGKVTEMFERDCTHLNLNSWFTDKSEIDFCNYLIKMMHIQYRTLSPKSIVKDNQLLEIAAPLNLGCPKAGSWAKVRELYQKQYGLKEEPFWMYVDKDGELKRYSTWDKPKDLIDYIPAPKKQ